MRYDPTEDLKKYSHDFDWGQYGAVKSIFNNWVWYDENEQRHNQNGPAYIASSGYLAWYINDKLHRDGGPAIVWSNGMYEYRIHGERVTEEEYWQWYYTQQTIKFMTGQCDEA